MRIDWLWCTALALNVSAVFIDAATRYVTPLTYINAVCAGLLLGFKD